MSLKKYNLRAIDRRILRKAVKELIQKYYMHGFNNTYMHMIRLEIEKDLEKLVNETFP